MESSAASPSDNDGGGASLKDDDSFTVVNSLGSSYLERYKDMMNDDGSLSSTSSLDSSSLSEAEEDDSSSSSSSDSDGSSSSSEEEEDGYIQQLQHHADLHLLTNIMKSKASRPTEVAWHQIHSSGSSNKNPQERLDDLCREYVDDEEENVWNLPLWELAAVLLDRLKNDYHDNGGSGEEEEESSCSSSSSSNSSSSSSNSSMSSSESSTSLSPSDEEDNTHHHDEEEDSLSQVSFHGTHHDYDNDSFTEDLPMSSPSSPSGNTGAVEHGEMPDDSTRKITSASADDDLNSTAVASIAERGKEVFSPSSKKRRLSQGQMQPTSSAASVGVAEAASAAKEAEMTRSPVINKEKQCTPSSFAQRAKRKLFEKEDPPPTPTKPKKSGKYIVTYDWISYFAAKAFLAARKELKAAEETEPPNNVKVSSKIAAKVTEEKRTSKTKRPRLQCSFVTCANVVATKGGVCIQHGATQQRKQCRLEGCHKQAQKGGLFCVSHGAQMFCSEVIGGTTQMNELCTSSEEKVATKRDE